MRYLRRKEADAIRQRFTQRLRGEGLAQLAPELARLAKRGPWGEGEQRAWAAAVDRVLDDLVLDALRETDAAAFEAELLQ